MNPIQTQGTYDVGSGAAITLQVTFGDGQRGRAAVLVDDREVARESTSFTVPLGTAAALRGSTVSVVGVVNRTSPSAHCSVRYELRGGPAPAGFAGAANFDVDGEPVRVNATFDLR